MIKFTLELMDMMLMMKNFNNEYIYVKVAAEVIHSKTNQTIREIFYDRKRINLE